MNEQLHVTARCRIQAGKLEEFKALAARCVQGVKEKDTGTLRYDWYWNAGQTECVVLETYKNSEAILEHITHLGAELQQLLGICQLSIEIYGAPSQELLQATQGMDIRVYSYFQGL